eukprot:12990037-Ditylum_brightwellii.AAC.1
MASSTARTSQTVGFAVASPVELFPEVETATSFRGEESKGADTDFVPTVKSTETPKNTLAEINHAFDVFLSKISISSFCLSQDELIQIRHKCMSQVHKRATDAKELDNLTGEMAEKARKRERELNEQIKAALQDNSARKSKMQATILELKQSTQEMESAFEYKMFDAVRSKWLEKAKEESKDE